MGVSMQYSSTAHLQSQASAGVTRGTLLSQLTQKISRSTKTGKPYLEILLSDATGSISLRVWDNSPWNSSFQILDNGQFIAVTADWQGTQYGLEISNVEVRSLTDEEEQIVLAGGLELQTAQQEAWNHITELVGSIQDPRLAILGQAMLENFGTRFRRAAAARGYHHARRGGLVEHTASVMRGADAICSAYPQLNRDLVLIGALFHDCGKMWENSYPEHSLTMPYSDTGELLGHISLGIEVVNRLWQMVCTPERKEEWKTLQPDTEQVRLHLLHLIAAHHGSLEFGSPVPPKTPEALALHHADDFDAKMEMFRSTYETSPSLSTHIYQRKAPLPSNIVKPLPSCQKNAE